MGLFSLYNDHKAPGLMPEFLNLQQFLKWDASHAYAMFKPKTQTVKSG